MNYRPEIDGLRAVAVAPVVLFHAGAHQISGGFLGVDIFFVISGFLITSIVSRELAAGDFSFARFYKRRARRILPMLLVVIACSAPFAWLFMSHGEFLVYGRSAIYVLLFVSNIFFYKQSGYFDRDAESSPLLHTWSLGVEEQYYILFPLLMWLLWRKGPRLAAPALALLFAASFAACVALARAHPDFTFYMLPTRAWELLAGALCALAPSRPFARRKNLLSGLGLALIAASLFVVREGMAWPSAITLAPVAGACLVLLYAEAGTPAARLLSSPLFRGLGLISYSAYLWHQPVFAFARIQSFGAPSPWAMAGFCLLVVALSILSWRFVEQPWRNGKLPALSVRRLAQTVGVTALALSAGGALAAVATQGFSALHTPGQQRLMAFEETAYKREIDRAMGPCFLPWRSEALSVPPPCLEGGETMMVWGDSHAGMLSIGVRALGRRFAQTTAGSCPPALDLDSPESPACRSLNGANLEQVARLKPARIVMHAFWSHYAPADLLQKLRETTAAIRRVSPQTRILIVGSVPTWRPNLPRYMLSLRQDIVADLSLPNRTLGDIRALDASLAEIAREAGADFFAPTDLFCDAAACRAVVPDGEGLTLSAFDNAHLTPQAARALAERLPL